MEACLEAVRKTCSGKARKTKQRGVKSASRLRETEGSGETEQTQVTRCGGPRLTES